ncbi:MAG TPA: alkaline phosphatase family protein, partial [Chloroflexota bacterium]|nr:alkaline phosphatase family protein [Chloroflexota bacterium]
MPDLANDPAFATHFIRPQYGSYCFSELPRLITALFDAPRPGDGTAERLLGPLAGSYEKVALCFIDAFGWRFFEQFRDRYPFLRRIMEAGTATKITSQFPSTTAAHVTTMHTGASVGESGVYEWFYYEPKVDAMIAPLLFSYAGDRERGALAETGVDPADLFPAGTLYQTLAGLGVTSWALLPTELADTPYGSVVLKGARVLPYAAFSDALRTVGDLLIGPKGRIYVNLYMSSIDTAGHRYGPESEQFASTVDRCFTALEQQLHTRLHGEASGTLFLLVADHGQMAVDPATTIYLNRRFPAILPWITTNRRGHLLAPAGSCRDFFLHIREEHLEEAHAYLHQQLAGHSAVYLTRDLIADGFFGAAPPSPAFLGRVGNLVVLPYARQSVFWYQPGRFEQRFHAAHGGLSPEEMETTLLA